MLAKDIVVYSFLAIFAVTALITNKGLQTSMLQDVQPLLFDDVARSGEDWQENARQVRKWRESLKAAVRGGNVADVDRLKEEAFPIQHIIPCEYVFIDFGANIGDSLGKFVDAGLPKTYNLRPRLDVKTGSIAKDCYNCTMLDEDDKRNYVDQWHLPSYIRSSLREGTMPEDYCYYGVEGNPHFTALLKTTEDNVMSMRPRPVRYVHFLTETVGTNRDGPTKLFLDTVNPKENFWGSSVMETHRDVLASQKTGVPVMGVTLTSLLQKAVKPGGHVIVKIDIEGAEYLLLEEAIESNILCNMVQKQGVSIHMMMEMHDDGVLGSPKPRQHWEEIQGHKRIVDCGVNFTLGDGGR